MSRLRERAAAARRWLRDQGDVSLGLAPQAFLSGPARDVWACFWRAARRVDDATERGEIPARWQDAVERDRVARADLAAALNGLEGAVRGKISVRFEVAWYGIRRRHDWTRRPPLVEYLRMSAAASGLPMRFYLSLADPQVPMERVARAADLLGTSVQLGDDVRDLEEDESRGLVTRAREEPSDVVEWAEQRAAMAAWFLAQALADWPGPSVGRGAASLGPALLWHRALAAGGVRPSAGALDLGVDAKPGSRSWYAALRRVAKPADESPEAVRGIVRQDLRHRARALDPELRELCEEAVGSS